LDVNEGIITVRCENSIEKKFWFAAQEKETPVTLSLVKTGGE
jgi:hypothetical protein